MASRKQHELYFKVDNRVAVSGGLEDKVLLQDLAVDTHGSDSDLVRACGGMLPSSMLLHAKWLWAALNWRRGH